MSNLNSTQVDPTLLSKFKCHPTIPCGIPRRLEDLDQIWHHVPDDLLPINWSSHWPDFNNYNFLPSTGSSYSMGYSDIELYALDGILYPIKGVMYCMVERVEPGGLFDQEVPSGNSEGFVFQDAIGDYYFFYQFSQGGGEYSAKFRAPPGTTVCDFVKHHFRGAVDGVDMDRVLRKDIEFSDFERLWAEQKVLVKLYKQARAEGRCACEKIMPVSEYYVLHWAW